MDEQEALRILRTGTGKQTAEFSAYQTEVVSRLLDGRNVLYVDKTGAGKSATYLVTTLLKRQGNPRLGPTIVITPLLALMNDQVLGARRYGLQAETLNGNVVGLRRAQLLKNLKRNKLDILFLGPEMLATGILEQNIAQFTMQYDPLPSDPWTQVALVVIDEVHCVSDWGHEFRPAYFKELRNSLASPWASGVPTLGCSATVPVRVEQDLLRVLGREFEIIRGDLFRGNLSLRIITSARNKAERLAWLRTFITTNPDSNILVFTQSRVDAETFARQTGTVAYHAELEVAKKQDIEANFKSGATRVVFATTALGMGFDKSDIHVVIHTYTPASAVQYYQEIGRAGRGIEKATAIILPTAPIRNDTHRDTAMKRILELLGRGSEATRLDIVRFAAAGNIKQKHVDEAIDLGIGRGYFKEHRPGVLKLLREPLEEEERLQKLVTSDRQKELEFMNSLLSTSNSESFCMWQRLLSFLGQVRDEWRCEHFCTRCAPRQGDLRVQEVEIYFRATTNTGIPILALAENKRVTTLDPDVIQQALISAKVDVAANPPAWVLTFIPNSGPENKQDAFVLAEALGLEIRDFITPDHSAGSMTGANTEEVRLGIIARKFRGNFWDSETVARLVAAKRNVVIYDDTAKSGMTIDAATKPLTDAGLTVIALVGTIYTGNGLTPQMYEL